MIQEICQATEPLKIELESHSIYKNVSDLKSLQIFMEHHVFSVWDFMSLVKFLQSKFSPSTYPWTPPENRTLSRFINEIVLEEESDKNLDKNFVSHFEMYCLAMAEIKANSDLPLNFVQTIQNHGLNKAIELCPIPIAATRFINNTYSFIESEKAHMVAAAFAFGRENVIPVMFDKLLKKMNVSRNEAPTFFYYLERHIELDQNEHGPLSLEIVSHLCGDDPIKWNEAREAAVESMKARIEFWNDVELALI